MAFDADIPVSVSNHTTYNVRKETAGRFLRDLNAGRYQAPASVFCSRDLENGLNSYVEDCIMNRRIPSDDDLRAKGREILGVEHTAADDPKLLERFKALHVLWNTQSNSAEKIIPGQQDDYSLPNFTNDVDMFAAYDQNLDSMDLSTDFSAGLGALSGGNEGGLTAQMEFENILGGSGATSSPLRRRASEKLAESWGFSNPLRDG